jgi:hypothetical protein
MPSHKGRCQCGAVTFEVTADPVMSGFCHCRDCQQASGAGHVMHVAFADAAVKIAGMTARYQSKADSGNLFTREFCPTCGGRLFGTSAGMPGIRTISAATFDDPSAFKPMMTVYASRALAWDQVAPGLPAFAAMPPMPK